MGSPISILQRNSLTNSKKNEKKLSKDNIKIKSKYFEPSKSILQRPKVAVLQKQISKISNALSYRSNDTNDHQLSEKSKQIQEVTSTRRKSWINLQMNATQEKFKSTIQIYHQTHQIHPLNVGIHSDLLNSQSNNNETNINNHWNEKLRMNDILEDIAEHSVTKNLFTRSYDQNDLSGHNNHTCNRNFSMNEEISCNICHICNLVFNSIESYQQHVQVSFILIIFNSILCFILKLLIILFE